MGKDTKIMAMTDCAALPRAIYPASASPHEVTLVEATLAACAVDAQPTHRIGDRACDSDPLDARLAADGMAMIAPHRSKGKAPESQDGRSPRRYKRQWKVERLFAWLQNFRRELVRHAYHAENYLGFVHLACIVMLLHWYL